MVHSTHQIWPSGTSSIPVETGYSYKRHWFSLVPPSTVYATNRHEASLSPLGLSTGLNPAQFAEYALRIAT